MKQIKIEKLVYGGQGLSRVDGKVIFTDYTIPEEIVEIKEKTVKKNFIEAEIKNIVEKSKYRVNPKCKYFGICGGCDWQHINYDYQADLKKDILIENLTRIAKIDKPVINNVIKSSEPYNYRNRTQIKVFDNKIGYYKKKSHSIIDIDSCNILHEKILDKLIEIRKASKNLESNINSIHIFATRTDDIIVKYIYDNKPDTINKKNNIKNDAMSFEATQEFIEDFGEYKLKIDFNSFFQVNRFQINNMINCIKNYIGTNKYKNILDLYCGIGTFTIPIAKCAENVFGIEINSDAVKCAKDNVNLNKIDNLKFYCTDTENSFKLIKDINPDFIVIDPPRSGLTKPVIDCITTLKDLEKIIYVSCDPSTFSRDLKIILANGFKIKDLTLIDMFPQTYHIESICLLEKS